MKKFLTGLAIFALILLLAIVVGVVVYNNVNGFKVWVDDLFAQEEEITDETPDTNAQITFENENAIILIG